MCKYKKMVFSGPLLTGKVGNESLLGVRAKEYVVKRGNSCQIIGELLQDVYTAFRTCLKRNCFPSSY